MEVIETRVRIIWIFIIFKNEWKNMLSKAREDFINSQPQISNWLLIGSNSASQSIQSWQKTINYRPANYISLLPANNNNYVRNKILNVVHAVRQFSRRQVTKNGNSTAFSKHKPVTLLKIMSVNFHDGHSYCTYNSLSLIYVKFMLSMLVLSMIRFLLNIPSQYLNKTSVYCSLQRLKNTGSVCDWIQLQS